MGDFAGGITENARIWGPFTSSDNSLSDDENANDGDSGVQVIIEKSLNTAESMENADISPNGLLQTFRSMLYVDSVERFEEAWEAFKENFGARKGLFTILNTILNYKADVNENRQRHVDKTKSSTTSSTQ